jgi:AraC-like DNA-binding protein
MMLAMMSKRHPQSLVDGVADMLVCERHRTDAEMQVIPMWSRKVEVQPKLKEVLQLMEANLEEPLSLQELSDYVHLSRRQLERLFLKHLHSTPFTLLPQVATGPRAPLAQADLALDRRDHVHVRFCLNDSLQSLLSQVHGGLS